MHTKEERFKLATDMELYQVPVFLGKEKKYPVRKRGRNPPPLYGNDCPWYAWTRNKEARVIKDAELLEARKR